MSMKRFARGAFRIAQEIVQRARFARSGWTKVPTVARLVQTNQSLATRKPLVRFLRSSVRVFGRRPPVVRPFSVFTFHRRSHTNEDRQFSRFLQRQQKTSGILTRIRTLFGTTERYNQHLFEHYYPNTLDAYEIGQNIGYGCNAAVYELRERSAEAKQSSSSSPRGNLVNDPERMKIFPLALKLMFNYRLDDMRSEEILWREMGEELVPLPESRVKLSGRMTRIHRLPTAHPNIIRVETAFVDRLPILEDARERYPEALPTAPFYEMVIPVPRTLFIVMKRYRMTLYKYAAEFPRNYWTGRVLLGQLLEALVFLRDNTVAQRDMKSDNILLDFNDPEEVPHLVLSDFGCALATGCWLVAFNSDDVDLGGNLSTRAPEIASSRPCPGCVVDFSKADAWAAGAIAHEIFTRNNPFYKNLKSTSYLESEVPPLPRRLPPAVKEVVKGLLKRDPEQRLSVSLAANVVCLSLFRFGESVSENLERCGFLFTSGRELKNALSQSLLKLREGAERALGDVMKLYAAETIFARRQPSFVSSAELQLRATFLSRLELSELQEAVEFFLCADPSGAAPLSPACERPSLNSLSSAGSRPPVPVA